MNPKLSPEDTPGKVLVQRVIPIHRIIRIPHIYTYIYIRTE